MKISAVVLLLSLVVCPFVFSQEPAPGTDLYVTKSGPDQAAAGSDVSYTITVANISALDAANVTLTDVIPPGMTHVSSSPAAGFTCSSDAVTVTCTGASLAAQTSAMFTIVMNIGSETPPGTQFTNIAEVSTSTQDDNEENNSSAVTTSTPPPPSADMGVVKTGPSYAGPDTDVVYTITVTNGGPDAAENVAITDTLPETMTFVSLGTSDNVYSCSTGATISCTAASVPAGTQTTFTLTGHVPADTQPGTPFTNSVTVESSTDSNEENNASTTTLVVSSADVRVTKTGPPTAVAGNDVTYSITILNEGANPAFDVVLQDVVPAGTTFVSVFELSATGAVCSGGTTVSCSIAMLLASQSATFQVLLLVGDTTSISNTATVTTESYETDFSDNTSTATTTVTPLTDLAVTKSGPTAVTAGTNVTWTVTLTNNGPSTAANVSITDTLPAGTTYVSLSQSGPAFSCSEAAGVISCTRPTLAPLEVTTFTVTAAVPLTATGSITNSAVATTTTEDSNSSNNSATSPAAAIAPPPADLSITKTADAPSVFTGGTTVYTLAILNNGPGTADNVVVTDVLPPAATLVSAPGCTGNPTLTCTVGTLAAGASASFTVTVTMPSTPQTVSNTAQVSTSTVDPNPANNSSTAQVGVGIPPADLSITKTAFTQAPFPGVNATYTIIVSNAGPGPADNVVVTDPLPAGVTLIAAPGCTGTTTITCNAGTLTAGQSATFTIDVRLPSTPGMVSNTASVTSNMADPATTNNTSSAAIIVTAVPAGIPTLSEWGLLLLVAALAAAVVLRTR